MAMHGLVGILFVAVWSPDGIVCCCFRVAWEKLLTVQWEFPVTLQGAQWQLASLLALTLADRPRGKPRHRLAAKAVYDKVSDLENLKQQGSGNTRT